MLDGARAVHYFKPRNISRGIGFWVGGFEGKSRASKILFDWYGRNHGIRLHHMKKITFFIGAAALLALSPAVQAHSVTTRNGVAPEAVALGDTFSFDISGFNNAGTVGYLLTPDETATFGATTTFTAAGINSQNISITSSETTSGTQTTDTFTVSTPTNFLTTTTVNGTKITQLQLDLGDANSGSNTVDYALPITNNTQTGNILYGTANTSFTLTPGVTLTNNNQSLAAVEGVSDGTTAISTLAVHSFTFSITYDTISAAVPESAEFGTIGGILMLLASVVRLHRCFA